MMPGGTPGSGCGQPPLSGPYHRCKGSVHGVANTADDPGIRSRSASSSTTCFPPAPVEISSFRWTKPSRVPVRAGGPGTAGTSTHRTGPRSTSTATTPSGSATATFTSGLRLLMKPPLTPRASAFGTCRTCGCTEL